MKIKIATYNTCGVDIVNKNFFRKAEYITKTFREQNPDIINFQEVVFYNHLSFLQKHLPEYKYHIYKPALLGPHAGLVTFSRIPLTFKVFKIFRKNGTIFNASIIHKLAQRGILIAEHEQLRVINTHFSANMSTHWERENTYTRVLRSQIEDLHAVLADETKKDIFFVISGDFNIPKTNPLYMTLVKNQLVDVFGDIFRKTHLGDSFIKSSPELQVDYLFTHEEHKAKITVNNRSYIFDKKITFGTEVAYPSDHFGLEAQITIPDLA